MEKEGYKPQYTQDEVNSLQLSVDNNSKQIKEINKVKSILQSNIEAMGNKITDQHFKKLVNILNHHESIFPVEPNELSKEIAMQRVSMQVDILLEAVPMGNDECVYNILVNKSFPRQTFNNLASTFMLQAARSGQARMLEILINNGAGTNLVNAQLLTALHVSATGGFTDCVQLLLDRGADINAVGEENRTPLYYAAYHGQHQCIAALLNHSECNIRIIRSGGWTHLHETSKFGYAECTELLIAAGSDLMYPTEENWWTPGHLAAMHGQLECLKILVRGGINIEAGAGEKKTVTLLHEAVKNGHPKCVEYLIKVNADITRYDGKENVIHTACRMGHLKVLEMLIYYLGQSNQLDVINQFMDVDASGHANEYCTAVHLCIMADKEECLKMLLTHGAKHLPNGAGHYPIVLAAYKQKAACLRILLTHDQDRSHGFNPSTQRTALQYLCINLHRTTEAVISCACMLINWGVDLDYEDIDLEIDPCLHVCAMHGAFGMVRYLLECGSDPNLVDVSLLGERVRNNPEIQRCLCMLTEAMDEPASLQLQARKVVRQSLGRDVSKVYEMDWLSGRLQNYIYHGHPCKGTNCKPLSVWHGKFDE